MYPFPTADERTECEPSCENRPFPEKPQAYPDDAVPPSCDPVPKETVPPPPSSGSALTATGYLTVSAGTARHAYPLAGAQIEIWLSRESFPDSIPASVPPLSEEAPAETSDRPDGMMLYRRQISGADGSAETVPIPTPDESVSLSPDAGGCPYTLARVRVWCRGYYPQEARQVPVFPGVNALQYFDLVPLSESDALSPPAGTLTVVSENVTDFLQNEGNAD